MFISRSSMYITYSLGSDWW